MESRRRLRGLAGHLCAATEVEDPPLGSLEGMEPELRAWTCAELGCDDIGGGAEAAVFPAALPDDHPAVAQFREWGYVVLLDALPQEALALNEETFHVSVLSPCTLSPCTTRS